MKNRLYRAPVLEGAGRAADPAAAYARHFVPNARAGVGLIVQGNTIVSPEGRTSPGMRAATDRAEVLRLRPMVDAVHEAGAAIVLQLGHGGMYALEAWHQAYAPTRTAPIHAASPAPWWLRAVHRSADTLPEPELLLLVERFGAVAAWAREAGYDGVQLAGANAKLLHQLLSRTYNRRTDGWGGSLEGRTRILREIRAAIARTCGASFPVLLKYTARELGVFGGITLEEGVEIARIAEAEGYAALTPAATGVLPDTALCRGDYPRASWESRKMQRDLTAAAGGAAGAFGLKASMWASSKRYPFTPVWNREVFAAVKAAVNIPVFAVGGIRTAAEARSILADGTADMVGFGRPFYAEPDLPRRLLAGDDTPATCASCNRCIVPQMLGMPGVCYNPAVNRLQRG